MPRITDFRVLDRITEQNNDNNNNDRIYLNGVQYYNITSEIMILASMKEGLKLMKGIKKMSEIMCADGYMYYINFNEINFMRTNLFTFF